MFFQLLVLSSVALASGYPAKDMFSNEVFLSSDLRITEATMNPKAFPKNIPPTFEVEFRSLSPRSNATIKVTVHKLEGYQQQGDTMTFAVNLAEERSTTSAEDFSELYTLLSTREPGSYTAKVDVYANPDDPEPVDSETVYFTVLLPTNQSAPIIPVDEVHPVFIVAIALGLIGIISGKQKSA